VKNEKSNKEFFPTKLQKLINSLKWIGNLKYFSKEMHSSTLLSGIFFSLVIILLSLLIA
jgi:hypothetical protein